MKKSLITIAAALALFGISACGSSASDSQVASDNLSVAADQFEIERRIIFVNGITDTYPLEIIGKCSIADQGNQLEVTCKIGPDQYKKHFLGKSDNIFYVVEQLEPVDVSVFNYRVIFKPEVIIPDVDLVTSGG